MFDRGERLMNRAEIRRKERENGNIFYDRRRTNENQRAGI